MVSLQFTGGFKKGEKLFFFYLYNIVLVLPYINMNPPTVLSKKIFYEYYVQNIVLGKYFST